MQKSQWGLPWPVTAGALPQWKCPASQLPHAAHVTVEHRRYVLPRKIAQNSLVSLDWKARLVARASQRPRVPICPFVLSVTQAWNGPLSVSVSSSCCLGSIFGVLVSPHGKVMVLILYKNPTYMHILPRASNHLRET